MSCAALKMKSNLISIALSVACMIAAIINNYLMAVDYHNASGKTQALFGLTYMDRYYYAIFGFLALIPALVELRNRDKARNVIIASALAILSIIVTFLDLWRMGI